MLLMNRLLPPDTVASSIRIGLAAPPIPPDKALVNVAISPFTTLAVVTFTEPGTTPPTQLLVLGQVASCGVFVQVPLAALASGPPVKIAIGTKILAQKCASLGAVKKYLCLENWVFIFKRWVGVLADGCSGSFDGHLTFLTTYIRMLMPPDEELYESSGKRVALGVDCLQNKGRPEIIPLALCLGLRHR